jgi:tetratricopeptide (TPR) repeat protein
MNQDPGALYSQAERAFQEGRFADARRSLVAVEPLVPGHPAIPHMRGLVERRLGNHEESQSAFRRAIRLAPDDPQLANNHGNLLSDRGDLEAALGEYDRAVQLSPGFAQARLNAAITLRQLGRHADARAAFQELVRREPGDSAAWNAWGVLEREAGDLDRAAELFARALELKPAHVRAAKGLAGIARLQGDAAAASLYARAARLDPQDRGLIIEEAEVRAADGDPRATERLAASIRADPAWAQGQDALARIRWEQGDSDGFLDELEKALAQMPANAALWARYIGMLVDAGRFRQAADAALAARTHFGDDPGLMLSEAAYAGLAADHERAERLFSRLPRDAAGRALPEARHRIRLAQFERASALLDQSRAADPGSIEAWSLTELLWRATGDERSSWLSRQPGLVRQQELGLGEEEWQQATMLLREIHKSRARPLGQSLREGTQTRHRLFDRRETALGPLRTAVESAIRSYVEALPPADPEHPLLRHRTAGLALAGSWSVRLAASGHHVSHVHPEGVISSACYIAVPDLDSASREGWLELGAPPRDLDLPVEPLAVVQPRPGRLVLFPSYLFHGTRPFRSGERLTVAFDVTPAKPG